jgi:GNAT superfamily N-acetyltransferase
MHKIIRLAARPNRFSATRQIDSPPVEALVAQLGPHHRPRVLQHLRALPEDDRRLRFGYAIGDDSLRSYVRGLHFSRDGAFGAFDEAADLLALGHLGFERSSPTAHATAHAEFGISVLPHARRRGLGLALLQRAAMHAANRGATQLVMTYLPGNTALAQLAARANMNFVQDQVDPRAYLALPAPTAATLMEEAFGELLAAIDLGFRVANAERFEVAATSA